MQAMTTLETPETAFALVKRDDEMFAPLSRREATKLKAVLRDAMLYTTGAYTFENEPEGFVSELAWLENMALRQSQNREAPRR